MNVRSKNPLNKKPFAKKESTKTFSNYFIFSFDYLRKKEKSKEIKTYFSKKNESKFHERQKAKLK